MPENRIFIETIDRICFSGQNHAASFNLPSHVETDHAMRLLLGDGVTARPNFYILNALLVVNSICTW
jgi:hypothetical protein